MRLDSTDPSGGHVILLRVILNAFNILCGNVYRMMLRWVTELDISQSTMLYFFSPKLLVEN